MFAFQAAPPGGFGAVFTGRCQHRLSLRKRARKITSNLPSRSFTAPKITMKHTGLRVFSTLAQTVRVTAFSAAAVDGYIGGGAIMPTAALGNGTPTTSRSGRRASKTANGSRRRISTVSRFTPTKRSIRSGAGSNSGLDGGNDNGRGITDTPGALSFRRKATTRVTATRDQGTGLERAAHRFLKRLA